MIDVKKGDTVKLLYINNFVSNSSKHKVDEVKEGDTGIVHSVKHIDNFFNNGKGYDQIWVKWSNKLLFPLIHGMDGYEVIKKVD